MNLGFNLLKHVCDFMIWAGLLTENNIIKSRRPAGPGPLSCFLLQFPKKESLFADILNCGNVLGWSERWRTYLFTYSPPDQCTWTLVFQWYTVDTQLWNDIFNNYSKYDRCLAYTAVEQLTHRPWGIENSSCNPDNLEFVGDNNRMSWFIVL